MSPEPAGLDRHPTFRNPLAGPGGSARFWTTVNVGEALPGVPTPLNWSWFDLGTERAQVIGKGLLGATPTGQVPSADPDRRHLGVFHGRAAMNVDLWRELADALPGTSGDALEQDLLGAVRPGRPTRARPGRYPVVLVKAPRAFRAARRALLTGEAEQRRWWKNRVAAAADLDEQQARSAFGEAFHEFERVAVHHLLTTMAATGLYSTLTRVCQAVGRPGLEAALVTGLGTEESRLLEALWRLARDEIGLNGFLSDFGHQGHGAGELATPSWRAEPALLDPVLRRYRTLSADQRPERKAAGQRAERERARRAFLDSLPRGTGFVAVYLLRQVHAYLPLRESGRGAILRTVDAARAAAWVIGRHSVDEGRMHRPEDVFMCTVPELRAIGSTPGADELGYRRERWEHYCGFTLPTAWQGLPTPAPIEPIDAGGPLTLTGIGTGSGIAEGIARVVTDPSEDADLEPGEILVCRTTDPSWATFFLYSAAVVIDIGGPLSHGAVVARELGIPCVINTGDGSRRVNTGDRVRVDSDAGTVVRLGSSDERVSG